MREAFLTRRLLPFLRVRVSSVRLVHFHLHDVGLRVARNPRLCDSVPHTRLGVPLPGPRKVADFYHLPKAWRCLRWVTN